MMSRNYKSQLFSDLDETKQECIIGGFNTSINSYFSYFFKPFINQKPFNENITTQDFSTDVVINNAVQVNLAFAIGENNSASAIAQQSIATLI